MAPMELSARALGRDIDVPHNRIIEILNGERAITAETALRLGRRFGTTPEFWLNLQTAHDLDMARVRGVGTPDRRASYARRIASPAARHQAEIAVAPSGDCGARKMTGLPFFY
jgi:antitoxin HigA-1